MTAEAAATPLRDALVDRLCQWHVIRTEAIEAALRSVPRHRFVPEVSIEAAYEDKPIPTKWKADGSPSSSASQPMIVAWQLEQLGAQPGDRILEIGAGTGYNAALLAELVGQSGEVTSVEFDPDMAERARHTLADTGYKSVRVITADGEYGCADRAPYDRIIVTTGAWDIPPAWADQLIPNGRLVVPLRLPGWPISIAFQRNEGLWRSISTHSLGFIPVDGAGAFAIRSIEIGGAVTLRIDDDRDLDVAALSTALDHPRKNAWTGIVVDNGSDWDHLYLWLAATRPGFCKFTTTSEAFAGGAVRPAMGWGGAAFHDGADFAYFTNRRANGQEPPYEIGIFAHGPNSQTLADDLAAQIRRWHRDFRSRTTARIEVHPKSTPPDRLDQAFVISKRHSTVALSFEPGTARSGYQTG